jgi:hypothetical protein
VQAQKRISRMTWEQGIEAMRQAVAGPEGTPPDTALAADRADRRKRLGDRDPVDPILDKIKPKE